MVRVVTAVYERPAAGADQPLFVEFVNTLHWYEGVPIELLGSVADTNAWLAEHHLPAVRTAAKLLILREHLRPLVEALANGQSPEAHHLAVFAKALSSPRAHLVLRGPTESEPHLDVEVDTDADAVAMFRIALSLANFLETGDRKRLKLCANPGCGFAFVDTSTNNTRRWCFMRYCGNRQKVRAFRQRSSLSLQGEGYGREAGKD